MRKLLAAVALLVALAWLLWPERELRHPPGILVADDPSQAAVAGRSSWQHNGYAIAPLAEFELKARVLSKKRYWLDRESDLAPVDLLLGWKAMSNQEILDELSLGQRSRWYFWSASHLPIPESQIESQCANMHIVPADSDIEKTLKSLHPGQLIRLKGCLISVQATDGWAWKSSLTRTDTGGGSCELVWAEELEIQR